MKKKLFIVFLCVIGLFCGLTCFAASDPNPPAGFVIGSEVADDVSTLTLGAGTGFYSADYSVGADGIVIIKDGVADGLVINVEEENTIYIYGVATEYTASQDSNNRDVYFLNDTITLTAEDSLSFEESVYVYYVSAGSGNLAGAIVDGLSDNMSSIGGLFVAVFTAAASVFYNNGLTVVGYLALIGLAIILLYYGIRYIKGLINKARAR